MTSSFQNVVGTPRDAVPDISKTNYLETAPDMTEAVNAQIDENIKDTKQFFDQMVELEELAASKLDKRLAAIESIVGSVGSILKKRKADQANEISKIFADQIKGTVDDASEEYTAFKNNLNLENSKATGAIDADTDLKEFEKYVIKYGLLSEEVADLNPRQRVKYYEDKIPTLGDALKSNGALDSTTTAEFLERGDQGILSWVRSMVYNEIEQGNDPTNPRFVRLVIKELGPLLKNQVKTQQKSFESTLVKRYQAEEMYTFDTRIIESVKGAVIRSEQTGKRLDDTLYKDEGVIHQIAEQKFQGDRQKATDYVFERIAELVKDGDIFPNEAREIYSNLPYERDGKVYDNYQAYVDKQTDGTGFKARAQGRVSRLSKALQDVEKTMADNEDAARQIEANNFVNKNVIPRIAENKSRGIDGLDEGQVGALINQYKQEQFYLEGVTPIPQLLLKYLNQTQTGGERDKNVQVADAYADRHNETDKRIDKMVARLETEDGNTASLTDIDLAVADRLKAEFRARFNGPDNKDLEIFELQESTGAMDYNTKRNQIMTELGEEYENFKNDKLSVAKANAGTKDIIKLRRQLGAKPELFYQKEAFKTEPVDNLFDYVQSDGLRNTELEKYYKALRIRVPDGKGNFRLLSGSEAIYQRAEILGLIDSKTLKVDPYAKVLQDYRKENDVKTFTSEQKVFRNMRTGEQQDFKEYLELLSEQRGEQNANQFTFVRNGNTSNRTNLNRLSGAQVVELASAGSDNFGMYNLSADIIKDLNAAGLIDPNKPFNEDAQSFAVMSLMAMKANRKSNAIRGAITDDTKDFGKLIKLTQEEQQVVNQVFPNLTQNYFAQFQNLEAEVAKIIISDIEKERLARKGREGQRQVELQRLRDKGDKKALRSGRIEREQVFGYRPNDIEPTTIEELKEVPAVKKAREGR